MIAPSISGPRVLELQSVVWLQYRLGEIWTLTWRLVTHPGSAWAALLVIGIAFLLCRRRPTPPGPAVLAWLIRLPFGVHVVLALAALASVVIGAYVYFDDIPFLWRAGGVIAGLAIALPLEYRYVRYRPEPGGRVRIAGIGLIGASGIIAAAVLDLVTGWQSNALGMTAALLATLWVMLVTPTLFVIAGWSARDSLRREAAVRAVGKTLLTAAALMLALIAYGIGIEPRFILDTEEHIVALPALPPEWEGATVAVISDLQIGLWLDNVGLMRRAVREIVRRRPRAVLMAGDFIYPDGADPPAAVQELMDVLQPLVQSDIPTFAVLGNHDWSLVNPMPGGEPNRRSAYLVSDALRAAGIQLLRNQSAALTDETGAVPLYLVGLGSHYAQQDSPIVALAQVPASAPRVVFMHHPDSFAMIPPGAAPLAVAGHTHGGQIRLPFLPNWSWITFKSEDEVHIDGWINESYGARGNRLYVTRGLGMSLVPIRINCPPEVTFFTLRRGGGTADQERDDAG